MSTAEYLQLPDSTARQVRSDKVNTTPMKFAPLFARQGVSAEIWCGLVKDFGKLFSVVAGQPQRINSLSSTARKSAHRFKNHRAARDLMASGSEAGS